MPTFMSVVAMFFACAALAQGPQPDATALVQKAEMQLRAGELKQALSTASRAVDLDSRSEVALRLRASLNGRLGRHADSVADFSRLLAIGPDSAVVRDARGSEYFKLGQIRESIRDFDQAIALDQARGPYHWKRGISCYYAEQYDEGRRQFEGYQTVDDNDVENAVWRFLCMARKEGVETARRELLKIRRDPRPWAEAVYGLYAGKLEPDDVLAAAEQGSPTAREQSDRLFYAHLYIGLYCEVTGDAERALKHIERAANDYRIEHYMGDVAEVHAMLRREAPKERM